LAVRAAEKRINSSASDGPEPHRALFYEPLDDKRVRCTLCPKGCVVPDGQRGYCRIRENRGGIYYSLVYGRPCTVNPGDPIEKKPFFHVYPGTTAFSIAAVGCNFACRFCQNWEISQARPEDFPVPYRRPEDIAAAARKSGAKTIAYTYSEPSVFYEYMVDCARAARERGVGNVVVSNGYLNAEPQKALFPLMDAIKIDFKGFTETFYADVCAGRLQPVLDSLKRLAQSDTWFEIVVLLIPTLNDGADELKRMTAWIVKELGPDVPLHFSRYHPAYKLQNIPATPVETLKRARQTAMSEGVRFVYLGNVPGIEGQDTICPDCKTTLIRRYGFTVLENRLNEGRCPNCGRVIPGRWG
jgi:pyruvate formate lyase activating enzyme